MLLILSKNFLEEQKSIFLQQRLTLTDTVLMELSQHVVGSDMEAIALEYLGLDAPTVRNRNEANKEKRVHFNFEILCLWRESSAENTKEVTCFAKCFCIKL